MVEVLVNIPLLSRAAAQEGADVELVFQDGQRLPASRALLAMASPVLKDMLEAVDVRGGEIKLPDEGPPKGPDGGSSLEAWQTLLILLHPRTAAKDRTALMRDDIERDSFQVYKLAHKYDMQTAVEDFRHCDGTIDSPEAARRWLKLADELQVPSLVWPDGAGKYVVRLMAQWHKAYSIAADNRNDTNVMAYVMHSPPLTMQHAQLLKAFAAPGSSFHQKTYNGSWPVTHVPVQAPAQVLAALQSVAEELLL